MIQTRGLIWFFIANDPYRSYPKELWPWPLIRHFRIRPASTAPWRQDPSENNSERRTTRGTRQGCEMRIHYFWNWISSPGFPAAFALPEWNILIPNSMPLWIGIRKSRKLKESQGRCELWMIRLKTHFGICPASSPIWWQQSSKHNSERWKTQRMQQGCTMHMINYFWNWIFSPDFPSAFPVPQRHHLISNSKRLWIISLESHQFKWITKSIK